MRFLGFWIIIYAVLLIGFSGCHELLKQADKAAEVTQDVAASTEQLMQSPIGQAVPGHIKLYLASGLALASLLANSWQEWRLKEMTKTTKAIVQGIDQVDKKSIENTPMSELKDSISQQMKLAGCSDNGRKIVNKLKIA